jgi:hypothetical protein
MIGLNEREVRDAMSAVNTESKARNVEVVGNIGACRINQKDN